MIYGREKAKVHYLTRLKGEKNNESSIDINTTEMG